MLLTPVVHMRTERAADTRAVLRWLVACLQVLMLPLLLLPDVVDMPHVECAMVRATVRMLDLHDYYVGLCDK